MNSGTLNPHKSFPNGTARFRKFGCTRTAFGVQPANSVAGTIYTCRGSRTFPVLYSPSPRALFLLA
jgi:hypothetical protein